MDSFNSVQGLGPAADKANPESRHLVQRACNWFVGLPNHLGAAIGIVATFAIVVCLIALIYDAPLSIPRERTSAALGINAVLPVALAITIYSVMRALRAITKRGKTTNTALLQTIGVDLTLMTLFVIVTYFHFSLKTWVQVINPNLYDEAYFAVDQMFRPLIDAFFWIRTTFFTLIPSTDMWYQAAFLLMFISGFCSFAISRNPIYPKFCIGVLLTMSLGALSYLVAPALGPFVYEQGLNAQATEAQAGMYWAHQQVIQHGMPWIAEAGPAYFTGALAAMPSLHIAHALVMTYFAAKVRSSLTPFFCFICFWVVIESVVSRWHYLIDLPFGLVVAIVVIWLTNRICRAPVTAPSPVAQS